MHRNRWRAIGFTLAATAGACYAQTAPAVRQGSGCAGTPAAAIEAARAGQTTASSTGFRVESVRWDANQRQSWAIIRSCDHAERPTLAFLTDLPHDVAAPAVSGSVPLVSQIALANGMPAVVHAGQVVRLWRADVQAHIELVATAEENAAVGAKVRLRLSTAKDLDGQYGPPRYLAGIVRGPADVEMEQ